MNSGASAARPRDGRGGGGGGAAVRDDGDELELSPLLHAAPGPVAVPTRSALAGAGAGARGTPPLPAPGAGSAALNGRAAGGAGSPGAAAGGLVARLPSGAAALEISEASDPDPDRTPDRTPPSSGSFPSFAPLRCAAAFECAAALADSPRPPPSGAPPCGGARVGGAVVIAVLAAGGLLYATPDNILYLVDLMQQSPKASMAAFMLVFTAGVIVMLPGMLFCIAAGAAFGFGPGAAISFVCTVCGMVIAFVIGRYLLHDAVTSMLLRRVPNFKAIDRGVAREGWKLVLLLRLSPLVPYNIMNYAMGATSIRLLPYALPSAAAALPYACLFSYLGSAADDLWALLHGGARETLGAAWLAGGLALAAASAYGVVAISRRLLSRAGAGGELGVGAAGVAAAGPGPRREYAAVRVHDDAARGGAPAGAAAASAAAAGGGDAAVAGGCAVTERAVNTYVITNPSFSRGRRVSVAAGV